MGSGPSSYILTSGLSSAMVSEQRYRFFMMVNNLWVSHNDARIDPGWTSRLLRKSLLHFTLIGVPWTHRRILDEFRENEKFIVLVVGRSDEQKSEWKLRGTIINQAQFFSVGDSLVFLGGEVNRGYRLYYGIWIVTGTYSSIYVASAFYWTGTRYQNRRKI